MNNKQENHYQLNPSYLSKNSYDLAKCYHYNPKLRAYLDAIEKKHIN